jgi:hypothetical protein
MFDVKHPALFLLGFDEIHRKRQISSHPSSYREEVTSQESS